MRRFNVLIGALIGFLFVVASGVALAHNPNPITLGPGEYRTIICPSGCVGIIYGSTAFVVGATYTPPLPPGITLTPTPTPSPSATPTPTPTATPTLTPTPAPAPDPDAVIVPDDAPTIADALVAAGPGGTVLVRAGEYEPFMVTQDGVTVAAYGDGPVWVNGNCAVDWVIAVGADDVTILSINAKLGKVGIVGIGGGKARMRIENGRFQDWNCADYWDAHQGYAGIGAIYAGPGHRIVGNTLVRRAEVVGIPQGVGDGIHFKSNSTDFASGGGHIITDNIIIGGYDCIGGTVEDDIHGGFDGNTLIARNNVSYCGDDGIQSEGGNVNMRIEDNIIREAGTGVALAPTLLGPIYIERNFIQSNTPTMNYSTLACFKLGNGGDGTAYLRDNDCTVGPNGDGLKQTNFGMYPLVATGNKLRTGRYVVELTSALPPGMVFDGNCYETTDPTRLINWGGARYDTLAAFRAATGQEANGTMGPCVGMPTPTPWPTWTPTLTRTAAPPTFTPTITSTPTATPLGGPMTTLLQDTFTAANGTDITGRTMDSGHNWTQLNSQLTVQSNQAVVGAGGVGQHVAAASQADVIASVDVGVPSASSYAIGLIFRSAGAANQDQYEARIQKDGGTAYIQIHEWQSGTPTTRASTNFVSAPDGTTVTITVTANGGSLIMAVSTGESINYTTAFNLTATDFGLFIYAGSGYTGGTLDNFLVTDIPAGGTPLDTFAKRYSILNLMQPWRAPISWPASS